MLTAVGLLVSASAFAQQVIEISGANFRPLPLALPTPVPNGVAQDKVSDFDQALKFDLTAAGIFQMLDRKGFLAAGSEGFSANTIDFRRWNDVGAEALVKTQLTQEGDQVKAELRAFTVGSGIQKFQTVQTGPTRDIRRLAHGLADAVYKEFTGEAGPFASRLAYVRRSKKDKDIYIADWDGARPAKLTSGGLNLLPALIPGADGAAYTSYRKSRPDLYVQKLGGEPLPLEQDTMMATGVAYSPDGKKIAYSRASGEAAQIVVANADGSDAQAITNTPYFLNSSPTWSPDGKKLAFVSNRAGSPQIYVMNADGSSPKRLTFAGNYNQTPDWSPRGDLIAFTARDEKSAFDIFAVQVETGKVNRLTQGQGNNEEPCFSPNGRLVMFTSTRNGGSQPFVMSADGSNPQMLPLERGDYATPDWAR